MTNDLVKRLRQFERWDPDQKEAADRIEALEKALRRLVSWGAACPTEREDRLSHAAEGAKAFHAARAALGEDVHD
jgi:predicted  nucleic acid-binding Zn-ribbon protein